MTKKICQFKIFLSLSRLFSGPRAVPYPPIIQWHGVGSSESLWACLQPPELHLCDLNQERDLGRLLRTLCLSPMQLACCHGNHWLPVRGGQCDTGHCLSGVYKGSEHWDQHYWHHGHAGKLLLWVCLTLLWLAQYFSWCKNQIVHLRCFCSFKLGPQQVEEVFAEPPQRLVDRTSALIELAADAWIVTGRQPLPLLFAAVYLAWQSLNPTVRDLAWYSNKWHFSD